MQWLTNLQERNAILYWFGWFCLAAGIACFIIMQTSSVKVNNINAFIKPLKFFLSIWIFSWTMGWIAHELQQPGKVHAYSVMVVIVMLFELFVITWQAANGRLSHFNTSNSFYGMLFTLMGIAISILTAWTFIIGLYFWKEDINIEAGYLWGIRLGIILFTVFSFEGGVMGAKLQHTIGAADGSQGLPFINWSKQHGDLRIAHFFGIHALQVLPLVGYYIFKTPMPIISFSAAYAIVVTYILWIALKGLPLFK
ncbi:MAG: hypothetical protein IPP72_09370 [Chitinophagaceae bacterium]|nr:hypothetical protein [Chitinophagaceae bacterium]